MAAINDFHISKSIEETWAVSRDLIQKIGSIKPRNQTITTASIITLSGDLGAGKTTITQGIAVALGISSPVTSPTYVIMKKYTCNNENFDQLVHIDAYRLKSAEDLSVLGWDEMLSNPRTLCVIEWPEKIERALTNLSVISIQLESINSYTRTVQING